MKRRSRFQKAALGREAENASARSQADIFEQLRKLPFGWWLCQHLEMAARRRLQNFATVRLSEFYSWYRLQQRLAVNARTVESGACGSEAQRSAMTRAELERPGQRILFGMAIEQEDSLTWKRIQDAKLKLGVLELNRQKFQRDTCELFLKWFEDKRAKEVLSSSASNSDKIEQLGQLMFGEDWKK
jgi:hypothetical protein